MFSLSDVRHRYRGTQPYNNPVLLRAAGELLTCYVVLGIRVCPEEWGDLEMG